MATWKKVIVSGSQAELESLNLDNQLLVGSNQQVTTDPETTFLSGSFSGSFQGDGSELTGLVTVLEISGSSQAGETFGTVDLLDERLNIVGGEGIDLTFDDGTNTLDISGQDATSTNKGIATFNTDGFVVASGDVTLADSTTGAVLEINGTNNEVEVSRTNGTVTVGLPDNVNISENLSVGGDLTVQGDVTAIQTTNLEVEDRYILLNSGSIGDIYKGGIIIDQGGGSGRAFILSEASNRWGFKESLASDATTGSPEAFAAAVIDEQSGQTDAPEYQKIGNIRVDNQGDIFIYA